MYRKKKLPTSAGSTSIRESSEGWYKRFVRVLLLVSDGGHSTECGRGVRLVARLQ